MTERLFVDANLFLRYLTNDVPAQADAVERLLLRAEAGEVTLVTNAMVIAEIVWTLESFYERSPDEIRDSVWAILNTRGLDVAERELVGSAADAYAEKNVDFIDAYNAEWMKQHDITTVCTFDRRHFARLEGVRAADLGG